MARGVWQGSLSGMGFHRPLEWRAGMGGWVVAVALPKLCCLEQKTQGGQKQTNGSHNLGHWFNLGLHQAPLQQKTRVYLEWKVNCRYYTHSTGSPIALGIESKPRQVRLYWAVWCATQIILWDWRSPPPPYPQLLGMMLADNCQTSSSEQMNAWMKEWMTKVHPSNTPSINLVFSRIQL